VICPRSPQGAHRWISLASSIRGLEPTCRQSLDASNGNGKTCACDSRYLLSCSRARGVVGSPRCQTFLVSRCRRTQRVALVDRPELDLPKQIKTRCSPSVVGPKFRTAMRMATDGCSDVSGRTQRSVGWNYCERMDVRIRLTLAESGRDSNRRSGLVIHFTTRLVSAR
jgi:hypothetical protein